MTYQDEIDLISRFSAYDLLRHVTIPMLDQKIAELEHHLTIDQRDIMGDADIHYTIEIYKAAKKRIEDLT